MKKTLKLLILLMSLALIIGALSVVAFAKDGEDEAVVVTGDYENDDITLEEALSEIFDAAEGEFVITLQGDCTLPEDLVLSDDFEMALTIDLNGYTLDAEDATCAFTVQGANALTITGSGEVIFGSQIVVTDGEAQFAVNGTGAGIKMTSTTEYVGKVIANGTSTVNFKNVIIDVDYDKVVSGQDIVKESIVLVNDGTKVTFENTEFIYTVNFFAGEGFEEWVANNKATGAEWKTQTWMGLLDSYFATICGESQLVLDNTYVKTPTSGVKFDESTGMDSEVAGEGKYALVMNNSTLVCSNDSPETIEFNKLCNTLNGNQRLHLFNFTRDTVKVGEETVTDALSSADVYLKGSYVSAPFRMIYCDGAMMTAEDPVHIIVDNSMVEQAAYANLLANQRIDANGEGLFHGGAVYMTFKNNSSLNLNGNTVCGGSGNSANNLVGSVIGTGTYCIDLEEGTRVNNTGFTCDKPEGTVFAVDPVPNTGLIYVLTSDASYDNGHYGMKKAKDFGSARGQALNITTVGNFAGRNEVKKYSTLSVEEIKAHPQYNPETKTLGPLYVNGDDKSNIYTLNEDETSYTLTTSDYVQIGYTYNFAVEKNDVSVATFGMYFDSEETAFQFVGDFYNHARPSGGGHLFYQYTRGQNIMENVKYGEWNDISFVTDYRTGTHYVLVNGVVVGSGQNSTIKDYAGYFDDFRLAYTASGSVAKTVYFSDLHFIGYNLDDQGAFHPSDYLPRQITMTDEPSVNLNPVMNVGAKGFNDMNQALAYAEEVGGFVNLNGDYTTVNPVYLSGVVRTNGYTFDYTGALSDATEEDGVVTFEKKESVNVSWYFGNAEDPATDAGKFHTFPYPLNSQLSAPETHLTVANVSAEKWGFKHVGWATTYVRPLAYATGTEYLAAIAGLEVITDFTTVTVGTEDVTFYPVYSAEEYAFVAITEGGVETYYTASDDITAAIARVGGNGTVKLLSNVTTTNWMHAKNMGAPDSHDQWHRGGMRIIDLNGYELFVSCGQHIWIDTAGGKVMLKSSRPGGVIIQDDSTDAGSLFNSRSAGALVQVEDPNNYVTVKAHSFVSVERWGNTPSDMRNPKATLNGGTYINLGNVDGNRGFIYTGMLGGYESLTATNCTFINAGVNFMLYSRSDDVQIYNNCTFINANEDARFFWQKNDDGRGKSTINFNNCSLSGYNIAGYENIKVTGTTVAAFLGLDVVTEEGKTVAYGSSVTMTWPAHLGESYVITGVKGDTLATITANSLNVKFAIFDEAAVTNYKWNGLAGGYWSANVAEGSNAADLNGFATEWANKSNVESLTALTVGVKTWKLEGTEFSADEKVALGLSGFGAFANVKLEEGFVLGVLVTPANYEFLSAESKALFTKVTLEGVDYYIASADRNVNQAFTDFTVEVTVEEAGCSYTTSYTVSVYDYLNMVFAADARVEMDKIASYIVSYLNNAYAFFPEKDADADQLAALATLAATVESNKAPEDVVRPEVNAPIDAGENLVIGLDLTATPQFIITSKVAGTVTFNGVTTNFAADEEVRLAASVLDFDNYLTFTLEGGVTGTFCLGNYAAIIAAAETIEGLDADQLAALKALVASFYDYVIYAENFR